jgi:hypothetical protein|nr:MAG TPA: endonuclease-like protein [Herelleviridae sp.]
MNQLKLFDENSVLDLVCRGWSRERVLATTGIDPGYHNASVKTELKGVDRHAYKIEHVKQRVEIGVARDLVERFATCELDKAGVLEQLGLHDAVNLIKLADLFTGSGLGDEFKDADRRSRRSTMRAGMVAQYGTDNPFKLEGFQEKAAQTREERYGARYTLAEGSVFAEEARKKAQERQSGLFPEGSKEDIRLRGLGSKGGCLPRWSDGSSVDRKLYLVTHVKTRCSRDDINRALEGVRSGATRGEVLQMLGISETLSQNVLTLTALFTDLGLGSEYAQCVKDKIAQTNMARYGGVSPMASSEVRERIKSTTLDRYGVVNASSLPEVKERRRRTVRERYGVDSVLSDPATRERARQTIRAQYGVDNVSQSEAIKDRKRETSMRHYGVSCPALDPNVRRRQLETLRRNHPDLPADAQGPLDAPSVRAAAKASHLARHGVENAFAREDVKDQIRQTLRERYGVDNPSLSPVIQERRRETMQERYGVDNPFASETVKEQIRQTVQERYGVDYVFQSDEILARSMDTKRKNGTFATSSSEDALYGLLVEYANQYGMTVVRQYCDKNRYPFAVDFYIPERDLFIELNGSWSHGRHWYEADREMDQRTVQTWRKKGEKSEYYRNALEVWTERDVRKREAAHQAELNYVTLWDGSETLSDTHLWFALGAPDGRDWEREYSWLDLPEWLDDLTVGLSEQIEQWSQINLNEAGSRQISWLARSGIWETFYARELQMWEADEVHHRKWGRLRARLLANRLHYLGRLPESALEVVRGLAISGEIRSYSTFVNTAMTAVLDRYEPTSLYDPCSGWGERMLTCAQRGVTYTGTDISEAVVQAHKSLIDRLGLTHADVTLGDSATRDMRSGLHEMVLTCPPYGDTEIYTKNGAENLDDTAFLEWWGSVVRMSVAPSTHVFAFQISEKWRQRMTDIAGQELGKGWRLADEIDASTSDSHFQRAQSTTKRRGETMVVFERV